MTVRTTKLYKLRAILTEEFFDLMLKGEPYCDKEGTVVMVDGKPLMKRPPAATLNVIRQYLRDQGIDSDPLEPGPDPNEIKGLPFRDDPSNIQGLPAPQNCDEI